MVGKLFFLFERKREIIMSENKNAKRMNIAHISPINKGEHDKGRGTAQVFVNQVGELQTAANGKQYLKLKCSGRYPASSGFKYTFGRDDICTDDGTMFFTITAFEPFCTILKNQNIAKGELWHFGGIFTMSEYTKKDGNTGVNIDCIAQAGTKIWPLEDGKTRYFSYVNRLNVDEQGKAWGCLTVRVVKPMEVKKTSAANEVGEMRVVGNYQNFSGVPYALGDVLDPKDGTLFMDLTFWSFALENAKKLNLQKGATLMIHGNFETREFTRSDGTKGYNVVCRDVKKFDVLSFGKKETDGSDATPAPAAPAAPAATPAPAAPAAVEDSGNGFQAPASFGDIVVPF
jgi:single-stranded DNA-binding protein